MYKKQEEELYCSHMIQVPQLHNSTIDALKCLESSPSLKKVKKVFHSKWKENYSRKEDEDSEKTSNGGNEKVLYDKTGIIGKEGCMGPPKPLKGDCRKCSKQGPKAVDCCSLGGSATQTGNINHNDMVVNHVATVAAMPIQMVAVSL
jgi:hypothetical protein